MHGHGRAFMTNADGRCRNPGGLPQRFSAQAAAPNYVAGERNGSTFNKAGL
jgi:hypothetical protein